MIEKNLYEILEVDQSASLDEIKHSYKRLVRVYHPDINKTKGAEIQFKLLNSAYSVLSNDFKRKIYNDYLKNEKIVPDRENSVVRDVKITRKEAQNGTFRVVNILNTQRCPKCMGRKFLNGVRCPFCNGVGEKKNFRKVEVEIKTGTQNGDIIYVGKINPGAIFTKDLFLKIIIEEPQKMFFDGDDIIYQIELPVFDVILGCEMEINTEEFGIQKVVIPPLSRPNDKIKLDFNDRCYAQIEVIFPKTVSNEEKSLYDRLREVNLRKQNARGN